MDKRRSRRSPALPLAIEALESRVVLSGAGSAGLSSTGSVEVASQAVKKSATVTTLSVSAGTLGQPITFAVSVRGAAAAGSPGGTVNILDHGQVIETLTLSPTTSANARYATSGATSVLTQPPGGDSYFFGKHQVSAVFIPGGPFSKSSVSKTFAVGQPAYTALAGGVKIATVSPGTGVGIQAGQTANVLYTGYLAHNGQVFDDSIAHGGTPLSFTVGAGQVVPGFDSGTAGMQVGETRVITIPPAEGYGATANGPIPGNSTLIFVVTLESIS